MSHKDCHVLVLVIGLVFSVTIGRQEVDGLRNFLGMKTRRRRDGVIAAAAAVALVPLVQDGIGLCCVLSIGIGSPGVDEVGDAEVLVEIADIRSILIGSENNND